MQRKKNTQKLNSVKKNYKTQTRQKMSKKIFKKPATNFKNLEKEKNVEKLMEKEKKKIKNKTKKNPKNEGKKKKKTVKINEKCQNLKKKFRGKKN